MIPRLTTQCVGESETLERWREEEFGMIVDAEVKVIVDCGKAEGKVDGGGGREETDRRLDYGKRGECSPISLLLLAIFKSLHC